MFELAQRIETFERRGDFVWNLLYDLRDEYQDPDWTVGDLYRLTLESLN